MPTTLEQLARAREYIREKDYERARKILIQLDHPRAQEWLKKIEQAEAKAQSAPPPTANRAAARKAGADNLPAGFDDPAYSGRRDEPGGCMALTMALLGALVGAGVGAGAWVALEYVTSQPLRPAALLIGLLAGALARGFAGSKAWFVGVMAVLFTLLALVGGLYAEFFLVGLGGLENNLDPTAPELITAFIDTVTQSLTAPDAGYITLIDLGIALGAVVLAWILSTVGRERTKTR